MALCIRGKAQLGCIHKWRHYEFLEYNAVYLNDKRYHLGLDVKLRPNANFHCSCLLALGITVGASPLFLS